jgi:hypothetical protein
MKTLLKFAIVFLALTGATTLLMNYADVPFLEANYWENHGVFFLIFITLFPRLTLLFSSIPFGGVLWWLGLIFAPRLLVATLATITYWEVNPVLVVISWLVAISGETGEKSVLNTQVRVVRTGGPRRREQQNQNPEVIEADFREIK